MDATQIRGLGLGEREIGQPISLSLHDDIEFISIGQLSYQIRGGNSASGSASDRSRMRPVAHVSHSCFGQH
jgi:hypothetical protein